MVGSFQRVRTFLSALINLAAVGGFIFLLYGDIIPKTGWDAYIHMGLCALFGMILFLLPFFKKNRIAFRLDWAALFLLLIPSLYTVLSVGFHIPFELNTFLPGINAYADLFYALFGYVLGYTFFEHSTIEYERAKAQERGVRRQARHEKRKQKAEAQKQKKRQAKAASIAEKDNRIASRAQAKAERAAKKSAKSTKKLSKA